MYSKIKIFKKKNKNKNFETSLKEIKSKYNYGKIYR
jgi:hypothetical protein